jgi:hypothetical protein
MERESQRVKEQTEASSQHDGNDRTTLGDLKMSKKGRVGTIRTGAATTGRISASSNQKKIVILEKIVNKAINIFVCSCSRRSSTCC